MKKVKNKNKMPALVNPEDEAFNQESINPDYDSQSDLPATSRKTEADVNVDRRSVRGRSAFLAVAMIVQSKLGIRSYSKHVDSLIKNIVPKLKPIIVKHNSAIVYHKAKPDSVPPIIGKSGLAILKEIKSIAAKIVASVTNDIDTNSEAIVSYASSFNITVMDLISLGSHPTVLRDYKLLKADYSDKDVKKFGNVVYDIIANEKYKFVVEYSSSQLDIADARTKKMFIDLITDQSVIEYIIGSIGFTPDESNVFIALMAKESK